MSINNKDTRWVNKLDDLDKQALLQLTGHNIDSLDAPREMTYCLYDISDSTQRDGVVNVLTSAGFEVYIFDDPNQPGYSMLEAKKYDYIISQDTYLEDTSLFKNVAEKFSLRYDGWYATN